MSIQKELSVKKPAIQFLLALGLGLSALSMSASALDYGTLRPRSTVDSTGLPSLNGIPPTDTGRPQVGGAYGKSWTSYFLGQSKGDVRINNNGSVTTEVGLWYHPEGYLRFPEPPVGLTPLINPASCYKYGYELMPLFTQEAVLNGGPPYDWTRISIPPDNTSCAGGGSDGGSA